MICNGYRRENATDDFVKSDYASDDTEKRTAFFVVCTSVLTRGDEEEGDSTDGGAEEILVRGKNRAIRTLIDDMGVVGDFDADGLVDANVEDDADAGPSSANVAGLDEVCLSDERMGGGGRTRRDWGIGGSPALRGRK
ncbi:hypothetical protein C0995_014770 [Termitomyces sp. Mi166|nr:hypothetical protein C0995_014770 [Termitomyces sp. Mi166\